MRLVLSLLVVLLVFNFLVDSGQIVIRRDLDLSDLDLKPKLTSNSFWKQLSLDVEAKIAKLNRRTNSWFTSLSNSDSFWTAIYGVIDSQPLHGLVNRLNRFVHRGIEKLRP